MRSTAPKDAAELEALETREWLESLDYVLQHGGPARVGRLRRSRIGIAYSLSPKTVIRTGYGISHIHFNRAGGGNILMTAHDLCRLAEVPLDQCEEWQVLRATLWTCPEEAGTKGEP